MAFVHISESISHASIALLLSKNDDHHGETVHHGEKKKQKEKNLLKYIFSFPKGRLNLSIVNLLEFLIDYFCASFLKYITNSLNKKSQYDQICFHHNEALHY